MYSLNKTKFLPDIGQFLSISIDEYGLGWSTLRGVTSALIRKLRASDHFRGVGGTPTDSIQDGSDELTIIKCGPTFPFLKGGFGG